MSAISALSLLPLTLSIVLLAACSRIVRVLIGCRSLLLNVMSLIIIWDVLGHVLTSSILLLGLGLLLAGSPVICVSVVVHYCARLH